ncbi:hypothetical protein V6N13_047577 [Hibiscus sabdariffa]
MIYPLVSIKTPVFLTNSDTPRIQERCSKFSTFQSISIFRSFQPQKPKTQFLNPVVGNSPGEVSVREGEKSKGSLWQDGFQEMLGLCGLGYWVQGFRCFPWLALNFHMAHDLNLNPSTLQLVQNFGNLPMVAKPLFGILSDALYIGGAHRIPYICIGVAGQALPALMACVLLSNMGAAITEVAKDALITEYGQKTRITGLQSYAFMALAAGGILGNLLGGYFLLKLPSRMMFLVFSAILSLQLAVSASAREEHLGLPPPLGHIPSGQSISENIRKQLSDLMIAISEDSIFRPLTWIVASIAMVPILSGSIFCYQTQCLHLDPSVIGMSRVIGQLMLLSLTVLYNRYWKQIPMRKLIGAVQIFATCNFVSAGLEGSLTSFLASALCLSSIVSGFSGVGLASSFGIKSGDYSKLTVGILIQFLAALLPLGWIHRVPMSVPDEKKRKKGLSKRNRKTRRVGRVMVGSVYAYRRERESEAQK